MKSNARQVAADIAALAQFAQKRIHGETVRWTAELQRKVLANASGRPGPNVITGNYRRSINRQTKSTAYETIGQVGTNAPQGRRLEHGFVGVDSRGRRYNQRAYPHFGPALDEIGPKWEAAIARVAADEGMTMGGGSE